jgi:hypothetical protein
MKVADFEQVVTAAGVPMSSKNEGAFQTISSGEFFSSDSDKTCMLSLDMAKRIDEKNPNGLIGKAVALSYAASRKSETPVDANSASRSSAGISSVALSESLSGKPDLLFRGEDRRFRV